MSNKYPQISMKGGQSKVVNLNIKHDGVTYRDVATKATKCFPKPIRDMAEKYDRRTSDETWDLNKWERYYQRDAKRGAAHIALATPIIGAGIGAWKCLHH
jgi:hypothetical protein